MYKSFFANYMKNKLKIGLFFETHKGLGMGGGYYLQLKNLKILSDNIHSEFQLEIISANKNSEKYLKNENFKVKNFEYNLITKFFSKLFVVECLKNLFLKVNLNHPFFYFLKKNKYDFIVFLNPSLLANYCGDISFAINIWDLDHKYNSQFPEHTKSNTFEKREDFIKNIIFKAFRIIVPHNEIKKNLVKFYHCNEKNVNVQQLIPILPSVYTSDLNKKVDYLKVFNSLNLPTNKKIIFYPAGYWAHKNHKYIIDAAKNLKDSNIHDYLFIFCGFDMGNHNYVEKLINTYGLKDHVISFKFLTTLEIISLYKYCNAVVMPTYGGPTNLPIFESFFFKKPIFYTSNLLKDKKISNNLIEIDILNINDFILKLQFLENKPFIKKLIDGAFEYYMNSCDEKLFQENYSKIFQDFEYLKSRWK
jgi:hypothetical protein